MKAVEELMNEAMADLKGWLRQEDYHEAQEELAAGEPDVALHLICSQLREYEIRISKSIYEKLKEVGTKMNMPAKTWEILLPLLAN